MRTLTSPTSTGITLERMLISSISETPQGNQNGRLVLHSLYTASTPQERQKAIAAFHDYLRGMGLNFGKDMPIELKSFRAGFIDGFLQNIRLTDIGIQEVTNLTPEDYNRGHMIGSSYLKTYAEKNAFSNGGEIK